MEGRMPKKKTPLRVAPTDAVRIVPLHGHAPYLAIAPAAPAKLTYRNGPLLNAVEVFTIFWGKGWKTTPQSEMIPKVNGFFDFILTSPLIDQLSEYNTAALKIGHGRRIGSVTQTTNSPGTSVTDSALQAFLQQQRTVGKVPKATANTLCFIYLPPGVRVVMGGSSSCQAFCGYHSSIGSSTFYAVMPYPACTGCVGGLAPFDALTSTSSHELCEAITDPIPGQGWYDDANGEIGDICAWQTKNVGAYTVQLEWSNKAGACL
jgi:hypothetical protein